MTIPPHHNTSTSFSAFSASSAVDAFSFLAGTLRHIPALALAGCVAADLPANRGQFGAVEFEATGEAAAMEPFQRGVALLHDFEYDEAAAAFRDAQTSDPDFAMAYWGEALTHNHPVWMQQARDTALAILGRLGATEEDRLAKAPTEREKAYLRALHVLYGEGPKEERDDRYAEAMRAVHEAYPDDEDAAAFYALALLGTAHEGRDIPTYMRAAAVVEEVFDAHPEHPGAVHYLIHSYDDPVHAPLGLRAARTFSRIAPGAGHAQHMTSHIFVALGMWDDVVAANERAVAVMDSGLTLEGQPPAACGHYPYWLHYGYLMQGHVDAATAALERCGERAAAMPRFATAFAGMRARHVTDTETWASELAQYAPGGPVPPPAQRIHAFVDAMAAFRRGAAEAGRAALARYRAALDAAGAEEGYGGSEAMADQVQLMELEALAAMAAGNVRGALTMLRQAADLEATIPFEFGPPFVLKPSHELLGEVLLDAGRPAEAAAAFEQALGRAPNRPISVRGLEAAIAAAGG